MTTLKPEERLRADRAEIEQLKLQLGTEIKRLRAFNAELQSECVQADDEIERLRADIKRLTDWGGGEVLRICELEADKAELMAALRDEPDKWSWDVLVMVGRRLLDEVYPADIFDGSSGDPGPLYVVALRNALAAIAKVSK